MIACLVLVLWLSVAAPGASAADGRSQVLAQASTATAPATRPVTSTRATTRSGALGEVSGTSTAATARDPDTLVVPATLDKPPAGRVRSGRQVIVIAGREERVREALREYPNAQPRAFLKGTDRWQISYYAEERPRRPQKEVAQVLIEDRTGRVVEAWNGHQVAWSMARGYPGAFGRKVNAPYIWIALCLLFVLPFLRPPLRLLHLDLAVLLAFSVSYACFGAARIDVSVPLVYPLLLYLLVRMLGLAFRRGRRTPGAAAPLAPLRLLTSESFLGLAIVFLIGFRIGLNLTNSNVIDVGYAGVIGADRISQGQELYGKFPSDNQRGDTYGPVAYLPYVPFELIWPWRGTWDDLPAAHAAAIAFDLACVLLLWLLGRQLRGPRLGLLLAYLWLAFPFTLLVSNSNANDSLVAALVAAALLAAASPVRRGVLLGLAGLTKFAPLALAPLFATYPRRQWGTVDRDERRMRSVVWTTIPLVLTVAVVLLPVALGGDLRTFYDRTFGFQNERGSPFSIWGLYELGGAQTVVKIGTAALAVAVAFVPRRRDIVSLSALAAAVLIALQLTVTHWFYLYVVWFLPLVFVAILARYADPSPVADPDAVRELPASERRVAAPVA